ncbi:MAG: YitT family protein [Clostridia bacterium]|nr:YitT family protein [Clostridia bacterium]
MNKRKLLKGIFDYIVLIIGGILVGLSVGLVLLPVKLTTGGFSGVATLMHYLLSIPAEISLLLLNIPAFIITGKILGLRYGIKSFIGMVCCSVGIAIGEAMTPLTTDFMLAALYGGALSGLGIALTYRVGGSTGGTDLIARLVHEKRPHMNMGEILLIVDGIIIAILSLTFNDIDIGLYSIVSAFVMTKVIDLILDGADFAKAVFVVTNKEKEISEYIHKTLNRTSTKITGTGTYTNTEKNILMCVVNKKEIPKLKEAIREIDNSAFTIVTTVTEAIGEGFKQK